MINEWNRQDLLDMDLADLRYLVNNAVSVYNDRVKQHKEELIDNLVRAYNSLRHEFPEVGYYPIQPHLDDCALSLPSNVFNKIGPSMSKTCFDDEVKIEVYG